jgi:hypothetical protein
MNQQCEPGGVQVLCDNTYKPIHAVKLDRVSEEQQADDVVALKILGSMIRENHSMLNIKIALIPHAAVNFIVVTST